MLTIERLGRRYRPEREGRESSRPYNCHTGANADQEDHGRRPRFRRPTRTSTGSPPSMAPGDLIHIRCDAKEPMGKKRKNRSPWVHDPEKIAAAESVLRQTKRLPGDPEKLLRAIAESRP